MAYGDMAANFNGMRFWNHILAEHDDVLGPQYNYGPYAACEENKWVQIKEVNWADYVDASFDEGHNCSKFRTDEITEKVKKQIAILQSQSEFNLTCPILPELILNLKSKYGEIYPYIINPAGHMTL
jgi:hypothetical protein